MERLNEIMGRAVHKRPQVIEQRSTSSRPNGQQGSQRPANHMSRRPQIPEQVARHQGQHYSPSAYPAQGQGRPLPSQPQLPGRLSQAGQQNQALPPPRPNYTGSRPGMAGANNYHQPATTYRDTPPYVAPATNDYYQVDAYTSNPPLDSDVMEEWEEDEVGMRYGDWEGEAEDEAPIYSRPARSGYLPAPDEQSMTREISLLPGQEPRSPLTRNIRPQQQIQQSHQLPSAPPVREAHTYKPQRITQPLSQRTLTELGRATQQGQGEMPPMQRPSRPPLRERSSLLPAKVPQTAMIAAPTTPAPVMATGVCKICNGAGYLRADVPFGHPNFGKPIACECKEAEKAEKRRQQLRQISNMHAFRDKTFNTFNSRVPGVNEAFAASQEYARDPDGWLVLIGRNGSGKTHLAAAIANQRLEKGSLVLFTTVPDLLDHLRATFAPSSEIVYDQLFSNMREAELLVLDDLGSEQSSSWASEKLFQLLNYRYNLRFPTVITTNNIRLQSVDERIRSRLMDASMVTSVTLDRAQDYRPHNPRR